MASSAETRHAGSAPAVTAALNRKVRQTVRRDLERAGVWAGNGPYGSWLSDQVDLGQELRDAWLPKVLGENDFALTQSNAFLGARNRGFAAASPKILAFGYEMGRGLCHIAGGRGDQAFRAGVMAAIFNLGIVLFDFILDMPGGPDRIFLHLDAAAVRELCVDPSTAHALNVRASYIESADLRVLLRIVAWFFARLSDISRPPRSRPAAARIRTLLCDAYRAENDSVRPDLGASQSLEISRAKSVLPFLIIGEIGWIHADQSKDLMNDHLKCLVQDLGHLFWLTDDLADVANDEQTGALNSVLLQSHSAADQSRYASADNTLELLLGDTGIGDASRELCQRARSICTFLDAIADPDPGVTHFRGCVVNYLRNWFPSHGA